jgi:hypothetical protein
MIVPIFILLALAEFPDSWWTAARSDRHEGPSPVVGAVSERKQAEKEAAVDHRSQCDDDGFEIVLWTWMFPIREVSQQLHDRRASTGTMIPLTRRVVLLTADRTFHEQTGSQFRGNVSFGKNLAADSKELKV